jgi:hypothetical protein
LGAYLKAVSVSISVPLMEKRSAGLQRGDKTSREHANGPHDFVWLSARVEGPRVRRHGAHV